MIRACGLDVLQGDCLTAMLGTYSAAEKAVPVKHSYFGNIARVVADRDSLFYVRGQGWVHVAYSLEVDAVTVNSAGFRDRDQQEVQVFKAVRHAGQPAVARPRGLRSKPDFAMCPGVVGADQKGADIPVKFS